MAFLIVAVVAVPVCFLAGYALTRLPGIFGKQVAGTVLTPVVPTTKFASNDGARPTVIPERSRAG